MESDRIDLFSQHIPFHAYKRNAGICQLPVIGSGAADRDMEDPGNAFFGYQAVQQLLFIAEVIPGNCDQKLVSFGPALFFQYGGQIPIYRAHQVRKYGCDDGSAAFLQFLLFLLYLFDIAGLSDDAHDFFFQLRADITRPVDHMGHGCD